MLGAMAPPPDKCLEEPLIDGGDGDGGACSWCSGTLLLRTTDGFARNAVFSNQIDLLQRYGGLGQNSAQQQCKFMSAVFSGTPAVMGLAVERLGLDLERCVLAGCALQGLGLAALGAAAAGAAGPGAVLGAFFGPFALGYGLMTSALPVLGLGEVPERARPAFSQRFFACLAFGGILGILFAGAAQASDAYADGFAVTLAVLCGGTWAFLSRRRGRADAPPSAAKGGAGERPRMWPLAVLVPFYAAYLQWTSEWYLQAAYMDRSVLGGLAVAPPSSLQAVERLVALTALAVLGRLWSRVPVRPPLRLSAGCALAALALLASGAVERARRRAPRMAGDAEVSSLGVAWLLPQYALIACAEALIFPAQTEWALGRPGLIGLSIAAQSAAAVLLGLLLPHIRAWVPQTSINDGHYDLFFFCLSAGCAASAAIFALAPASAWRARPGG